MLTDSTIILRHGARSVIKQRAEVLWNDGSRVWLHRVVLHGFESLVERAIDNADGRFRILDITKLVPSLDEELRHTHERDVTGLVFYTLRHKFSGASEFRAAAAHFGELTERVPPAPGSVQAHVMRYEIGELEQLSAAEAAALKRHWPSDAYRSSLARGARA